MSISCKFSSCQKRMPALQTEQQQQQTDMSQETEMKKSFTQFEQNESSKIEKGTIRF